MALPDPSPRRGFAAMKLRLHPLHGVPYHLRFCFCSCVVLRRPCASGIRLSAHLARLARANLFGAIVSFPEAPRDGFELFNGLALDFRGPSGGDKLQL